MKRGWMLLITSFALLLGACGLLPAAEAEVPVATSTSTPLLDMDELAERTYTPTFTPTATETPLPSATVTDSIAMKALATVTATPSVTPEATSDAPEASLSADIPEGGRYFVIQEGAPIGMPNWAHQDIGCDWLGVAGQVFDLAGDPVLDLIVEVGGTLEGEPLLGLSLTGVANAYGPGGYEIQLADHVVASYGEAWILIKDDAGQTLSGKTYLETFDDCDQNLLLMNFVEVEEIPDAFEVFLPLIDPGDPDQ